MALALIDDLAADALRLVVKVPAESDTVGFVAHWSLSRRLMPAYRPRRRGRSRRLPLLRRCPCRCAPPFQHGAHRRGLLVLNRAHRGGDVARRKSRTRRRDPRSEIARDSRQLVAETA